eukprot:5671591-Pleurochrysis_carterae.AAC.1
MQTHAHGPNMTHAHARTRARTHTNILAHEQTRARALSHKLVDMHAHACRRCTCQGLVDQARARARSEAFAPSSDLVRISVSAPENPVCRAQLGLSDHVTANLPCCKPTYLHTQSPVHLSNA